MRHVMRSLAVAAALSAGAACANKDLLQPRTAASRNVTLRLVTAGAPQLLAGPSWLWVAAVYNDDDGYQLLSYKYAQLVQGSQQVDLPVDLGPCLASNASQGKEGCSLYVAAMLVADTLAFADSTRNPIGEAYDSALPMGPFEVAPGRVPTIPPIDLSMSRLATVLWTGDEALRTGGRDTPAETVGGMQGELAPISGVANGAGAPIVFALMRGPKFTYTDDPSQFNTSYPTLAIFENGTWRRVTGPDIPFVNGSRDYNDVTALGVNEVYMSSTSGLFRYDGATVARVNAVTDALVSVASTVSGGTKYVIAGSVNGGVWIGNGQTWQRYALPVTNQINGVCITGPNEAFATSANANIMYRFDGTAWTSAPTPQASYKINLQCPAPGQAFVLNGGPGAQAYRWTGSTWTALPTTGRPLGRQLHWGVVSANEIYAYADTATYGAGGARTDVYMDRIFLRFDGTTWTTVDRRQFTAGGSRPWAVPTGGAAYVFGMSGRLERISPAGVTVVSYQPSMRSVFVNSASSAFVVGLNSFLARFNGAQWIVDAPPSGTPANRLMTGVWSDGPSNAWAVGQASTVVRWTGSAWSLVSDSLRPAAGRDSYHAVWGIGSDVWAVGDNTILHCTSPTTCANEASGGAGALLSVWGSSAGNVIAVGDGGRILRYNGSTWTAMQSPTTRSLVRVHGSSASDVWALGDSVLVHFDGSQWTSVPMTGDLAGVRSHVPTPAERVNNRPVGFGLWVRGPREVYVGGQYGNVVRFDGTGWAEIVYTRYGHQITSLHGVSSGSGCALAVTEAQYIPNGPTLWRGVGPAGCFSAPMIAPAAWP